MVEASRRRRRALSDARFYCTVVFVIVNEVVRRFVFQYSSLWGEEVARYAFIYLGWVGAVVSRQGARAYPLRHGAAAAAQALAWLYLHSSPTSSPWCSPAVAIYWSLHTISTLSSSMRCPRAAHQQGVVRIGRAARLLAHDLAASLQSIRRDIRDIRAGREAFKGALLFDCDRPSAPSHMKASLSIVFMLVLLALAVPFWVVARRSARWPCC